MAHLSVEGVSLVVPNYVHRERSSGSWLSTLLRAATSRLSREDRTLLQDISFRLADGDRLALLGRNGAGKTTLLRVLAGSLQPTRGRLDVQGSCQALLNLGLGFNSEATVRENIYLRATAMGLRPAQIRDLVGPILEFAELGGVASHRLATLSSGQRMRLGFAVSTSVQHDIMLLDEWFGSGDAGFVERARARMSDRVQGSSVVVLASHNFQMLRQVCNLGMLIEGGRVAYYGTVEDAIAAYKATYQTTDEYKTGRRAIEEEAQRLVHQQVLALKRADRERRNEVRAQVEELKLEKARLRDKRAEVERIRERLELRLQRAEDGNATGESRAD